MSYALDIEEIKRARWTQAIVLSNVVLFIVVNLIVGYNLLYDLGQLNFRILEHGEWWRLFSAIFVHADISHLLSNMLALIFVGSYCEHRFPSKWQFMMNYLLSGVVGNLFTLWIVNPYTFSLGASGAIAGLYGSMIFLLDRNNPHFKILSVLFLINFFISSFQPGVGTWAHIFGLLTGLLSGYFIDRKSGKKLTQEPGTRTYERRNW